MNQDLHQLLVDLDGLSDEEAEAEVLAIYLDLYTDNETRGGRRGERLAHDGTKVVFWEGQFEHAFRTTRDKANRPYAKVKFDRSRGRRVRWIGEIIGGNVEGVECWLIPPESGRRGGETRGMHRLYVLWEEQYAVFLVPRKEDGWRYSTAHVAATRYLREYTMRGVCKWRKQTNTP